MTHYFLLPMPRNVNIVSEIQARDGMAIMASPRFIKSGTPTDSLDTQC